MKAVKYMSWLLPSIKSRNSIFTLRGLSRRLRNISAVTIGYLSNSSVRSCGKTFLRGVHLLSLLVSPSAILVARPLLCICGGRGAARAGRAPRARHWDARCENSCRNMFVTSGESIGDYFQCRLQAPQSVVAIGAEARGEVRGSLCQDIRAPHAVASHSGINIFLYSRLRACLRIPGFIFWAPSCSA